MDNLFEIARRVVTKEDENKFIEACKKRVACVAKHRIDENGNPFHIAASKGFLLSALQKIIKDLEKSTRVEVEKAKEAKDWEEVKRLEKELKNNKKYIKEALLDKSYIKDNKAVSPLYFLDPSEQKEVKQIADIKCGFICNKKFHICLYIVGAIVCATAMCVSLYLLFSASQSLALASIATIASGGSSYLLFKACNEVYGLYNESTIVTDPDVMQLLDSGLAPV
ncbi:ankyrin repeat domain-containing protein [Wolbachia endosymbiont of Frankliniella intonsa]|uniref:ankyrin repeat domain-containing protein n=1 Tax=Wolbachia endosymbiont of Frankliniella intonsa TaxID=2902422 RepID=UPI00244EBB17|nr:ankyrin repeat domain-containing protein [Wolbachia endosymbiont of Frankliniella intonsa]WGJ62467.1 ankyrin repeat domain-containing protein [Wolbachia endosymbiont of Frankliniella intonsa]